MLFGNIDRNSTSRRAGRPGLAGAALAAWVTLGLACPAATLARAAAAPAPATAAAELIPYEKFTLDNGLTVVVHTDRKAPIVAVNLWYHVGSKNEPAGKTGFAHLFEHLMFQGTENYDDEYFKPLELVGATSINGTTSFDRTNYFQNVPTTALDLALWMESDRMGHLLGVITQARLDEQRGVVQNEKRQGENRPYGKVSETVFRASFPPGHPYRTLPIGSMEDLDAASLDDVRDWFRNFYGAANAVLVLAGDIDVPTARAKAEQYFGHIPPGPALARPGTWIAERSDSRRETLYDQVAQPRWQRFWNTPPDNTRDAELLGLVGEILGGGKTSRLYERLVYRERLADMAAAGQSSLEIAGLFTLQADAKQGVPVERVEAAMLDELNRFIEQGPTAAELERARIALRAGFVRGLERIGGFGGKADVLASCEVYTGDPGCYRQSLRWIDEAQPADLQRVARQWLSQGDYTLQVLPQPSYAAAAPGIDRASGPPVIASFPDVAFPELQRARLSNGLPVIVATRPDVPVARVALTFDGGFIADQGRKPGTASFAMSMLDEGAGKFDALQLADRAERLGAQLGAGAGLDLATASVALLTDQADASLALLADIVRRPRFATDDIERVRKEWIAGIAREKLSPEAQVMRILPPLLYGAGHPYAIPFSGTGTAESIAALTRDDLLAYHRERVRPDNATIIVTGALTPAEVLPLLERHFGDWTPPTDTPLRPLAIPAATPAAAAAVYLLDRPGAGQSTILAGQLMPSSRAPDRLELNTANDVIGGTFTSRINMNLRETRHWSYGARSSLSETLGQRPWLLSAPVQTDKTVESIREIQRELQEFTTSQPATAEEVAKIRNRDVRALSGQYETNAAVGGAIADMIRFGRPDDYIRTLRTRLEAQTEAGVRAAAANAFRPGTLTWVIVGDLAKIEASIRDLGLGPVQVIDADGKVLR
jgi:predicted Zn-dependent peptidase